MMNLGIGHRALASIRIVVSCRRVRQEQHVVVAEQRITSCRQAAVLSGGARDDHRIDLPLAKNDIQISAEERAVAMLLDDMPGAGTRSE